VSDIITAVDLFCGAGGFTRGLVETIVEKHAGVIVADQDADVAPGQLTVDDAAARAWLANHLQLVAVNHDDKAVETYRANNPWARVHNAKVQALHPPEAVDGATVDILIAGPSCIPHSPAKGGMADHDQKRMGPRHVAHWLELLRPGQFLLENVPAFTNWGPLERDPDSDTGWSMVKDGSLFDDWIGTLRTLGYTVEWRTFTAADYGDPQTRKRLFVQGRLEHDPAWPTPTHGPDAPSGRPYRCAADIIDWSDTGESMWTKSRPLKQGTNERIARGIREYGADVLSPFADAIASLTRGDVTRMQEDVVDAADAPAAARRRDEPFLVAPPADLTARDEALCLPYVLAQGSGGAPRGVDEPVPTITASGGVVHHLVPRPFVLPRLQRQRGNDSNPAYDPTEQPLHTVTAKNHDGRVFCPFVVNYQGRPRGVDEPLPTVVGSDTLALCTPEAYPWGLDVRYRMLQPRETMQAQGFPPDYELAASTKSGKRELIGNAVPAGLAKSLTGVLFEPTEQPTLNRFGATPEPAADASVTGGAADDD
jgi:DNA (cytosine-5)-methyltransferase 1